MKGCWQILTRTHASKFRCFSGTSPFFPMTVRSRAPAQAHPGEALSWEAERPLEGRPSWYFLSPLGFGLALGGRTGAVRLVRAWRYGSQNLCAFGVRAWTWGSCESLSLQDPLKSDSKLGIMVTVLWGSWRLSW